ncbi:hypothetical protein BS47DRAFT_1364809 [Hydnum rufescens UP504]|uniref:Aminoglycoside phosphotransferase domain-containing protein n=1 Tax=Hydnum rufescens UP504 TaxID=1448309 RepID=A0A9P6AQF2_9AGAM|nr:hypothetical protein BS47DRAFT_1364809 [Hydnum rufescens UP504]
MRVVHRALRSVHSQSTKLVRALSTTNSSMVASNGLSSFEFTSSRWLFDEDTHLAARRVSFDVEALKAVACEAVRASRCTSFTKVAEGFYNKIYTLKFETGPEVIARVPHSIAVPRVLAWSASDSRVGSAYIIMEKIEGATLKNRTASKLDAYDTHRAFWRGERASMNIDRGPWRLPADFLAAVARSEIAWITEHARPRAYIDYERTDDPPATHIETLERYIRAVQAPGIAPQHPVFQPTLWHPDLNPTNIITTSAIDTAIGLRSVIDWQHAYVKSEVNLEWNMAKIQKVYTAAAELLPIRDRIAQMPHRDELLLLYGLSDQCWAAHFLQLRFWLNCLQVRWPGTAKCPIGFTEDETSAAEELYTDLSQYEADCELVYNEIGCTDDGEMKGATQLEIEAARARCAHLAAQWDENEHGGPFPLRAGLLRHSPGRWVTEVYLELLGYRLCLRMIYI